MDNPEPHNKNKLPPTKFKPRSKPFLTPQNYNSNNNSITHRNNTCKTKSKSKSKTTNTNTNNYSRISSTKSSRRTINLIKFGFFTVSYFALVVIQLIQTSLVVDAAPSSPPPLTPPTSTPTAANYTSTHDPSHHSREQDVAEFFHRIEDFGENCTLPALWEFPRDIFTRQQRQSGAILLHFLVSAYIFYAILIICDHYFVPSVESICRELKMPSDVAGATFMAASTSAPELFTNFIGTFVTKGDMGLGTIVGSSVFNILAVASICGIGAGWAVEKLKAPDGRVGIPLEWWPLTRDCLFYVLSVGSLITVLFDLRIVWYEAAALIALYALYIVVLYYNTALKQWTERLLRSIQRGCCKSEAKKRHRHISRVVPSSPKPPLSPGPAFFESTPLLFAQNEYGVTRPAKIDGEPRVPRLGGMDDGSDSEVSLSSGDFDELLISKALLRSASYCIDQQAEEGFCGCPGGGSGCWTWMMWIVGWPMRSLLTITIPDCRKYEWRKWYGVTLLMCVLWIGGLSYVLSWMMTVISDTIGIPDSVTGLTLLAAGTSIPEVFSSVLVARQGLGSMALANSIGSNTFDILVCLGLPWLVQSILLGMEGEGAVIEINSKGLEISSILIIGILAILFGVLVWNGFWLDMKVGVVSLLMYLVFIVIAILLEMNVFLEINLPVCRVF